MTSRRQRFFIAILLLALLTTSTRAQNSAPANSNTPVATNTSQNQNSGAATNSSNNQQPTPSPSPEKTESTSVKITRQGIELSGFPTWIIWVLITAAVVAVCAYGIWSSRTRSSSEIPLFIIVGLVTLIVLAIIFLAGGWWGRRSARSELQQILDAKVTAAQLEQPQAVTPPPPTPTPSITPTPAPTPSNVVTNNNSNQTPVPFYANPWGFALLFVLELLIAAFLYMHYWIRPKTYHYESFIKEQRFMDELRQRQLELFERLKTGHFEYLEREQRSIRSEQSEQIERIRSRQDEFFFHILWNMGIPPIRKSSKPEPE